MSFDKLIHPYNHYHNQRTFSLLQKFLLCPFQVNPPYLRPQVTILFSITVVMFLEFHINGIILYILFLSGFFHSAYFLGLSIFCMYL